MDIATKQDIKQIVKQEIEPIRRELLQAIDQIGKPRRMKTDECAAEWGVTNETAIKRLKRMYVNGQIPNTDFDSRPITVDRKEFFQAINNN